VTVSVRIARIALASALVLILAVGITVVATPWWDRVSKDTFVAYFANANGLYTGDEVRILGVAVGRVDAIQPQPSTTKITFSIDAKYPVPADVRAAILSPSLVSARAIQLVPAYSGGPKLPSGGTISQDRTAVPVEWDDFRQQLEKLTDSLQPTTPGGPNAVGEFINSTADNLRGEGDTAHDTVVKLSQAVSALGDHSTDIFSTVRNLQLLVSALTSSSDLLAAFNVNLADVTTVLSNTPNEIADATRGLDGAVSDLRGFVADNREGIGTATDHLAAVTKALNDSRGDVKQVLHIAPTVFQNFMNIYQPAQSAVTGILAAGNFANTLQFICSGIQAASRENYEQSSKLCVQYLAPIIKNRQYNFPPLGFNPFVGASARPNELTYSEDWLRPDAPPQPPPAAAPPGPGAPLPAGHDAPATPASGHTVTRKVVAALVIACLSTVPGCEWRGLNSLKLPGTEGGGDGAYTIQAQLPDVVVIQQNTRVRVADVNVGNVTKIEVQDWHALVTMRINGDVHLPANVTAKVGQTSLLGSMHIELDPPTDGPPEGELKDGSVIPLSSASTYPTTEQTLASVSILLNGGGLGQLQEINQSLAKAFAGRENDMRSLLTQLDTFIAQLNDQTDDIITATQNLNSLAGQVAAKNDTVDHALTTIPKALAVLADERTKIADAIDALGKFSAIATTTVNQSKDALVANLRNIAPVLRSLADAGPALTKGLDFLSTYPWVKSTLGNWFRGDFANISLVVDLTLSRIDSSLFTGTRWEGNLTELEMQWGRTIGQMPSPYTAGNPLVVPYHFGGY
jgi:virulence factor Mce-like protein